MGRHQCTDREGMLDGRQGTAGVLAVDLEDDADAGRETAGPALAGLDDLQSRRGRYGSEWPCVEPPLIFE